MRRREPTPLAQGGAAVGEPNNASVSPLCRPMRESDIDAIVDMERRACSHPAHAWSAENYRSSLAAGYWAQVLQLPGETRPVGVLVAMQGVDEVHLLNVAVDGLRHGQGLASQLMQALREWALTCAAEAIWLEVRPSNTRARAIYQGWGFADVSRRRAYYPAVETGAGREDAWVMRLALSAPAAAQRDGVPS